MCVCHTRCTKGFFMQGKQGVHSSAANKDSCGYSVNQIEMPICVPALQPTCSFS